MAIGPPPFAFPLIRTGGLADVCVGRRAPIKRVVIDRGARIRAGLVVGEEPELDAARFQRTEAGVTLITQPMLDRLAAG